MYIWSASTKRETIVFIYHNFKARKQSSYKILKNWIAEMAFAAFREHICGILREISLSKLFSEFITLIL